MSDFENEYLWWTKLMTIGQWVGGIATFIAVLVSLYLARSEKLPRLSLNSDIFSQSDEYLIRLKAVNTGKIPIPLKDSFYLILPDNNHQNIDPKEIIHNPDVVHPGNYWEVTFDLNYILMRLESAHFTKEHFRKVQFAFEDQTGKKYFFKKPLSLPELFEEDE